MRLLHVDSLDFHEFYARELIPKYVTASHRWLKDETTFRRFQERVDADGEGYKKVELFAKYVRKNVPSIKYLWLDSCCIDRNSAAELSEAVNLMFDWYYGAALCIAHLADVKGLEDDGFETSEWFERGWTLQELLAPRTVLFVDKSWQILGNKGASHWNYSEAECGPGLEHRITKATGIPEHVLHDFSTSQSISADDKLKWMDANRKTTREEDLSYALYGIFGVALGANYGENRERARQRLIAAIHPTPVSPAQRLVRNSEAAFFSAATNGDLQAVRRMIRADPRVVFACDDASGQTVLHLAAKTDNLDMVTYLIRNDARINADDDQGRLPLHEAVEAGNIPIVRALVSKGADISARDGQGRNPGDVCESQSSLLFWILSHGASLEARDEEGRTALCHFARCGDLKTVGTLLDDGANIEAIGSDRNTPLSEAVHEQQESTVELLLARGANVHVRNSGKATPLCTAGWHGYTRIGELLLDAGADINASNVHQYTALHECCDHLHLDMASMLVRRGADLHLHHMYGLAPIHQATRNGWTGLIREMLDYGVDVDHRLTKWLSTSLHHACAMNHRDIVELLLSRGANVDARDSNLCTPYFRACQAGHVGPTKILLEAGADASARDEDGTTPLCAASALGQASIVQFLLEHAKELDVDARNSAGYTPLNLAARQGLGDVAILLINSGRADIEAKSHDGWNSLAEACYYGHPDIVRALLDRGARQDVRTGSGKTAYELAKAQGHERVLEMLDLDIRAALDLLRI